MKARNILLSLGAVAALTGCSEAKQDSNSNLSSNILAGLTYIGFGIACPIGGYFVVRAIDKRHDAENYKEVIKMLERGSNQRN